MLTVRLNGELLEKKGLVFHRTLKVMFKSRPIKKNPIKRSNCNSLLCGIIQIWSTESLYKKTSANPQWNAHTSVKTDAALMVTTFGWNPPKSTKKGLIAPFGPV
jgi:hypothetical protein